MNKCLIVDLDGTIANCSHRLGFIKTKPKNWNAFLKGIPNDSVYFDVVDTVLALSRYKNYPIFLVTGRPTSTREITEKWLFDEIYKCKFYQKLLMRKENDYRPDYVVKLDILNQLRDEGYNPVVVFEDKDSCVKMYREEGLRVFQVNYED